MNKKVTLKEIVGTKIVCGIILVSYYWMWARSDWKDWYETAQFVLGVFLFSFLSINLSGLPSIRKNTSMKWQNRI